MPAHGPLHYRQRDIRAALQAAKEAGLPVAKIEVDREGKISLTIGQPATGGENVKNLPNPWLERLDRV